MSQHTSGSGHQPEQGGALSFLNAMTPTQTFVFGIVGGIMTLCTIGFFVLLNMVWDGGSLAVNAGKADTYEAAPTAPSPAVPPAPAAPRDVTVEPAVSEADHIRGNGKVTIVEFSDFECPFCARFHPTMQQVMDEYDGQVQWVFRHFPLESLHPNARKLANASECAAKQGKFWEFADEVAEKYQTAGQDSVMRSIAQELGLNVNTFMSCVENETYDADVQADIASASAAGCTGTPCNVVIGPNGETTPINGALPFNSVKSVIDPLLN